MLVLMGIVSTFPQTNIIRHRIMTRHTAKQVIHDYKSQNSRNYILDRKMSLLSHRTILIYSRFTSF